MRKFIRFSVLLAFFVIYSIDIQAQKEKNNIYLFDCTGSMITNKLWEPAKQSLDATVKLDASIPGSHVTIIPFGDNPYETYSFPATAYASKSKGIFNSFDKYIKQAKYTHISDVVEEGLKHIDANKDNRLYLLTDGKPNQGDTPEKVAQVISRWCANHKNSRFFYVALTKGAIDSNIRKALDDCPDAFLVELEGNVIPQFADISSDVYTNLEELAQPREIEFNLPGNYEVKATTPDSLFDVRIENNRASDGKIRISLTPKPGIEIAQLHDRIHGEDYEFPVTIQTVDPRYYIVNPVVDIHVSDEIPSKVSLGNGADEIAVKGAKWHDKFLWSPMGEDEKITWDLAPMFENKLHDSALSLRFSVPSENEKDYQAWYNGESIENGDIITIFPDEGALLSVQFNHKAKTGKRYFELTPAGYQGLDLINDQPADEYKGTTLRTDYTVEWNPLGRVLFWIGIGLIGLLILWFIFLQRWFYPRIKMGRVEFTGPDSYYTSKKIKGARKVVLTSKNKKQNPISRLFTGEVKYVKADHFSPELEIQPSSGKKKVKVTHAQKGAATWDIYPSSIFKQDDKGSLKNRDNNNETNIFFT